TYCLSILCEHDAAAAALGEVLALAERQRAKLRDPALRRPWLYALARWACLRRLAAGPAAVPSASEAVTEQRAAQLALLAWPEAAGTTPEQREALELAVRHQLTAREVAHVLGLDAEATRSLLAQAACEVERTRTALAVVDTGHCPAVAQLAGDARVLLGTALRGELVRHVDDCAVCRRTAERVVADGPWPGAAGSADAADSTAVLALVEAPRSAAYAALLYAMDAGLGRARDATPRYDRRGFPLDLKDRAARRAQLRHRAVTGAVVAAVVAAPVLAVWAAYQAAPLGEGHASDRATSEPDGLDGVPYEKAGSSQPSARPVAPGAVSGAPAITAPTATTVAVSSPGAAPPTDGSGYLTVSARAGTERTLVVLTAGGATPVRWEASTPAYWLQLSARGGTLQPGRSVTIVITVDRTLEPQGSWDARIGFAPGHAAVILRGSSPRSAPPPPPTS
ncbi:DNA-directed RNA polymerase specialized sigma subunit, sigma24 family, partial [Streptomyces sp. DvalAA-14]